MGKPVGKLTIFFKEKVLKYRQKILQTNFHIASTKMQSSNQALRKVQ